MTGLRIESLDDERLAPFRHLKATNQTRWTRTFVAEGDKLVRRLLASTIDVESVLVTDRYAAEFASLIQPPAQLLVVADEAVEALVGFNFHRGILAFARRPRSESLLSLTPNGPLSLVVCPDVQDPENLGAILRISAAFGASGVVLGAHCADPYSRRVLRVSMGAVFGLPVFECEQLPVSLAQLRRELRCQVWATVTDPRAESLDGVSRPERLAILLGSEGHGLGPEWLAQADRQITIPMRAGFDSLNVAVAAGIFLYRLLGTI